MVCPQNPVSRAPLHPGMDQARRPAYISRMNIGTRIITWLNGSRVGEDGEGNIYYQTRRDRPGQRRRRWVMYAGVPEATMVPPEWHAWLHYTTDAPISLLGRKPWQKPHLANATGTAASYRPPGHDYSGGQRPPATGDYEAWTPGS